MKTFFITYFSLLLFFSCNKSVTLNIQELKAIKQAEQFIKLEGYTNTKINNFKRLQFTESESPNISDLKSVEIIVKKRFNKLKPNAAYISQSFGIDNLYWFVFFELTDKKKNGIFKAIKVGVHFLDNEFIEKDYRKEDILKLNSKLIK